jgi:hypothetical protein
MIKVRVIGIISCALAAAGTCSWGQTRNELPGGSYLTLRQQSAWLLNYPMVVRTLNLTAAEKAALAKARTAYEQKENRLVSHGAPTDAQVQELDRQFAGSALAALSSAHQWRLFEALLQVQGTEALTDKGVAERLGLSPGERERIHEIFARANLREEDFEASLAQKLLAVPRAAPASLYAKKRNAVVEAATPERKKLQALRKADEDKALAMLTPKQQLAWKDLLGQPFPLTRYRP